MAEFYTYMWLREDGTPYYVGKGHGNRAFRKGSPPVGRILLQEFPDEESAFTAEIFLIALYGRKDKGTGILRNMTDGGENPPNHAGKSYPKKSHVVSEETRRKISRTLKQRGHRPTPEAAAKGWQSGNFSHSAETKERISESTKKQWAEGKGHDGSHLKGHHRNCTTPEGIEKMRAALKGKPWSKARRAAQDARVFIRLATA